MALPSFSGRQYTEAPRRRGSVYTQAAPDLPAMEANVANRMRPKPTKANPPGWSRGKAPWKTGAMPMPPGIARAKARSSMRRRPRPGQVTGNV